MIPTWRKIQRQNFTDLKAISNFLEIDLSDIFLEKKNFSFNLPRRIADKIEKRNANDPILLQFLPSKQEAVNHKDYLIDPVEDKNFAVTPRLLHKYSGRVLLMPTSACAMHCRYCFRQNFIYQKDKSPFSKELDYIAHDPSINEVILSGGDPLSLNDNVLKDLVDRIGMIKHIDLLRFHTRFPIGIPERITSDFLEIFAKSRLQSVIILHINHARELDSDIIAAMKKLQKLGIPILTQSVLLKDVNDNLETLLDLCQSLIKNGIIPYYLHQLDRVQGTQHFEVSPEKGRRLVQKLRELLPGYGVFQYVQEIPHEKNKTQLYTSCKHPISSQFRC